MERADIIEGNPPIEKGRRLCALGLALGIHALIFWMLSHVRQKPLNTPAPPIAVKLVITQPLPEAVQTPSDPTPSIEPELKKPEPVIPKPEPVEPEPVAPIEPETPVERPAVEIIVNPAAVPPPPNSSGAPSPERPEPIPDKWRLPPGSRLSLDKLETRDNSQFRDLSLALNCLGFEADCAEQRKSLFSEEQLSNTDLVWMASEAHSGLSDSDLYGLSEAQIRERLGIPTAGKNGFAILPGIAIDGPWWDALHGVNKACGYSIGVNESGSRELKKNCKPLKPSSKDRIGFIPKPVE